MEFHGADDFRFNPVTVTLKDIVHLGAADPQFFGRSLAMSWLGNAPAGVTVAALRSSVGLGLVSVDPNTRRLYQGTGEVVVLDWEAGVKFPQGILDNAGLPSIVPAERSLSPGAGVYAAKWGSGVLTDGFDVPFLTVETDPLFTASEAALLATGDKAKLDSALQTAGAFATAAQGTTADTALQPNATADGTYSVYNNGTTGQLASLTIVNSLITGVTVVP